MPQLRRTFWEKGEVPPEDRKQENKTQSQAPQSQNLNPEPSHIIIKEEPVEAPVVPKSQPTVIILDDSPPRSKKRSAADVPDLAVSTIKSEPIDLDIHAASASINEQIGAEGGPAKKIKLEPGTFVGNDQDDSEARLNYLKQEDERQEEELRVIQRMAEMLRKRNERKAEIAALEARANSTPRPGSPI